MSDLIFRADKDRNVTVIERAKGVEPNTLCVLTEKEAGRVYAWLGYALYGNPVPKPIQAEDGGKKVG